MSTPIKPEDELSVNFAAKRWDNSRKAMEDAVGTKDHTRLAIEHDIAGLHYTIATQRETIERMARRQDKVRSELVEMQEAMAPYHAFLQSLPDRLAVLEGAYAHLTMRHSLSEHAAAMVEAYKIGKASGQKETPAQES